MTDEYKERIIKWLTGNFTEEPSTTDPLFQDLKETTTDINTYIDTTLGYIKGKDGKGNDLDIGFIYGLDSHNNGIILIVDDDFNIIQVIDEFNTGTKFDKFVCLNIDTTNGNIYGVDYSSNKYRFILLNNFLIKTPNQATYEVKLRQSYFLEFTNSDFVPYYVEKRPSDSFYAMIGMVDTETNIMVATYKIEVGSTNELQEYVYTETYTGYLTLKAYNIAWSGEEYLVKIGAINLEPISFAPTEYTRYLNIYEFNGTTITRTTHLNFGTNGYYPSIMTSYEGVELTNNEIYVYYNKSYDKDSVICKLKNNELVEYFSIEGDYTLDYTYTGFRTLKMINTIYFYGYENTTSPGDNTQAEFKLYFGVFGDIAGSPVIYEKSFDGGELYNLVLWKSSDVFTVSNLYNLSTYHLLNSRSTIMASVKQVYNPLNDNYSDWQTYTAMVPTSVWLYNNDEIIYARNLYNKTLNGNTTIATVEVPNMLLNNINIEQQDLLGETNGTLIENIETITKNVYEDLFINFYNTLTMQNQNTQDYITNLVGASRLNAAISNTRLIADYTNSKIGKVRMNYSDNTSATKSINAATRISQFVYQFSFQVYVPNGKTLTSVELISNDEGTSYQTIDTTPLESGKTYRITQNVEIGE